MSRTAGDVPGRQAAGGHHALVIFALGAAWLAVTIWVGENPDVLATVAACGISVRSGARSEEPVTERR